MDKNIIFRELLSWVKTLSFAFVAALMINVFIFEMTTVSGTSMSPTLNNNDRLFSFKINQIFKIVPEYGDIVVVDCNTSRLRTLSDEIKDSALISTITRKANKNILVKRVIGKSGDTLEFINGKLYRNGELLEENYIKEDMINKDFKITIPDDHIFVMGDNRNNSKDSRTVGPIPVKNVLAKVLFRAYPFDKIGKF